MQTEDQLFCAQKCVKIIFTQHNVCGKETPSPTGKGKEKKRTRVSVVALNNSSKNILLFCIIRFLCVLGFHHFVVSAYAQRSTDIRRSHAACRSIQDVCTGRKYLPVRSYVLCELWTFLCIPTRISSFFMIQEMKKKKKKKKWNIYIILDCH